MNEPSEEGPPSLERRHQRAGIKPGDRYVRIVRPAAREFRRVGGHYVATEEAVRAHGNVGRSFDRLRRVLFGKRLESEADLTERLGVPTGLAILGSDNISSSAYATEEAMRVLALAGAGALALTMPIAIAVVAILAIVVMSQLQVIRAYPNGGGSYVVTRDNVGAVPGLFAASALLIDYVLTVSVSAAAGVAAIASFAPELLPHRVPIGLAFIALLMIGNLRGIREAGLVFAAPTYFYIGSIAALIVVGMARVLTGDIPAASIPPHPFGDVPAQALGVLLVLRAFASGSVGLTGSEAISNGVPSMKRPEQRNATTTLLVMAALFGTIFLALTFLAQTIGVRPDELETETLNSLITRSVVGNGTIFYYAVQAGTALILALAANTGFTGFPRLASVLAKDRFMPRHFAHRGERLAFSTGIIALAVLAGGVLAAFGGSVTALIPLYTIGVFLAFTLSQGGLVRRWWRLRPPGWRVRIALNAVGAVTTGIVLLVVAYTKFLYGAWMVLIVLPALVGILYLVHSHYRFVSDALVLDSVEGPLPEPVSPVVIVPIARIDRAALQALTFARSIAQHVRVVHIATSAESADDFERRFKRWAPGVPIDVIESPYRALVPPLLRYIDAIDTHDGRPITVVLAEFVARTPLEILLHSQTALRLKGSLLFRPNTVVVDVPYHHEDTGTVSALASDRAEGA